MSAVLLLILEAANAARRKVHRRYTPVQRHKGFYLERES